MVSPMALTDTAPYGSTGPVIHAMETFRDTGFGGAAITPDLVGRLGYKDEVARRVVLSLSMLGFIDETGKPTPAFIAFKQAPSSDYKQVLADVLTEAYAGVFAITGMDLGSKTQVQLEDAFRPFRPDSLRKRMVALFIGLAEYSGLVTEIQRKKPGPRTGTTRTPAPARRTEGSRGSGSQRPPDPKPQDDPPPKDHPPGTLAAARQKYVELLLAKVAEQDTPDDALLDRIERALGLSAGVNP
jgi:hypothetical protein